MFKTIFKTAFKTLLLVAVVALVAFGVASLGFPSQMASLCEKSGNYSMATGYASLSYTYTKDVNDLNRCFIDSVYASKDKKIVDYGDELIQNEKFAEVCEKAESLVEADYKQYVCGRVAAAKFRLGKKDEALETAKTAMEDVSGFPKNNALAILSLQVIESADKDTADKVLTEITQEKFTPAEADKAYYDTLVDELSNVCGQE